MRMPCRLGKPQLWCSPSRCRRRGPARAGAPHRRNRPRRTHRTRPAPLRRVRLALEERRDPHVLVGGRTFQSPTSAICASGLPASQPPRPHAASRATPACRRIRIRQLTAVGHVQAPTPPRPPSHRSRGPPRVASASGSLLNPGWSANPTCKSSSRCATRSPRRSTAQSDVCHLVAGLGDRSYGTARPYTFPASPTHRCRCGHQSTIPVGSGTDRVHIPRRDTHTGEGSQLSRQSPNPAVGTGAPAWVPAP